MHTLSHHLRNAPSPATEALDECLRIATHIANTATKTHDLFGIKTSESVDDERVSVTLQTAQGETIVTITKNCDPDAGVEFMVNADLHADMSVPDSATNPEGIGDTLNRAVAEAGWDKTIDDADVDSNTFDNSLQLQTA